VPQAEIPLPSLAACSQNIDANPSSATSVSNHSLIVATETRPVAKSVIIIVQAAFD